jgi:antirestriction protein ArdC
MDRTALYARVTAQVVRQIEDGAGEWKMPWQAIADAGEPVNALTHKPYRGGNHLLFGMVAVSRGWSGEWATYKQWQQLGAQVRRGEKATYGVKWSVIKDEKTEEEKLVPYTFAVFAAEQVDGWQPSKRPELDTPERIAAADAFFSQIGADVRHGGNRAAYVPSGDFIILPEVAQFATIAAYYGTSAHEHAHWSGHRRGWRVTCPGVSGATPTRWRSWSLSCPRRSLAHGWGSPPCPAQTMPHTWRAGWRC